MIKNFNYTNRKRIPRNRVQVAIDESEYRLVDLRVDMTAFGFPSDSRVFLDAFTSGSPAVKRFDWGTVEDPESPADRSLDTFGDRNVFFTLKVVQSDGGTGRLLGVADRIQPDGGDDKGGEPSGSEALLPVNRRPLGSRLWTVSFEHDLPWLEVNSEVPSLSWALRSNEAFFALVLPEVVRQILVQILVVDRIDDVDIEDEGSWRGKWLRWATRIHPYQEGPPLSEDSVEGEAGDWIDAVVDAFCRVQSVRDLWESRFGDEEGETA